MCLGGMGWLGWDAMGGVGLGWNGMGETAFEGLRWGMAVCKSYGVGILGCGGKVGLR